MQQAHEITGPMSKAELQASFGLSAIFALRMLGLFIILPVFSLFAEDLAASTPFLIGLAISVYGLTQAIFQIPFGIVSDHIGRKPVIAAGLLVFALGSLIAALSDSIYGVIAGRAFQGAGAIASAVMALAADLTHEAHRGKAMGMIGISIGLSFAIALILGPVLGTWLGINGLFGFTAVLAVCALTVLFLVVPKPTKCTLHPDAEPIPKNFARVVKNPDLLRLDFGIFTLHLILTAGFVVVPLILRDLGFAPDIHWSVYLPILIGSIAACTPFIILADKEGKIKPVFLTAIAVVVIAHFGLFMFHRNSLGFTGFMFLFFTGFNLLEATLPSWVTKIAPVDLKGTALGVYSTSQFMGTFIGGLCGGWIFGVFGPEYVLFFTTIAAGLWWFIALGMNTPRPLSSLLISVGTLEDGDAKIISRRIQEVEGVAEAVVLGDAGVAYLKVDQDQLDRDRLLNLTESK